MFIGEDLLARGIVEELEVVCGKRQCAWKVVKKGYCRGCVRTWKTIPICSVCLRSRMKLGRIMKPMMICSNRNSTKTFLMVRL